MDRTTLRIACLLLTGMLTLAAAAGSWAVEGERPNILFIMADDHTSQAFGCYGSRFASLDPTPNIDRLASQGVRFENLFCTNSICAPSRASILTGLYSHKNTVKTLEGKLDPAAPNVAKLLRASGYTTAIVGKWHLKTEPAGFDYWKVLPGQGKYNNPTFRTASGIVQSQGHSTDVITDLALEWLKDRDASKPFFLMCHFKASHEAWQYNPRYKDLYEDTVFPEPESLFEDQSHRSTATRDRGYTMETLAPRMAKGGHVPERLDVSGLSPDEARRKTYQHFMKAYFRTIRGIDDNVARLLEALDEAGLADNTLVVYTSDQGYFLGEHDYIDKRWMFEESLRMPTIMRLPGVIEPNTTTKPMAINTDFAPTFLDLAGLDTPDWMQGRSLLPLMRGETPSDWRRSFYYHYWTHQPERPSHYGVRTDDFKLMHFYGNAKPGEPKSESWELYDLRTDPNELKNVYREEKYAETITELEGEIERLQEELEEEKFATP